MIFFLNSKFDHANFYFAKFILVSKLGLNEFY